MLRILLSVVVALATSSAQAAGPPAGAPRELVDLGSDAAEGVFPRTVKHLFGETRIAQAPVRIAVISTGQMDAALALGVVPAGATRNDNGSVHAAYLDRVYPQLAPALANTVDLGNRSATDIETLAQLKPDLILMNQAVLKQDIYATFSRIAPTVVTRGNGINWKTDFLLLGDALGRRAQAQAILDRFHADADAFAACVRQAPPTVSFLQSTGPLTRVMGLQSLTGGIAADLGLARPESQRFAANAREISTELLDLADADWIFYAGRGKGLSALSRAPLWPSLKAVQNKTAVEVDIEVFYLNAGPTASRIVLDTVSSRIAAARGCPPVAAIATSLVSAKTP